MVVEILRWLYSFLFISQKKKKKKRFLFKCLDFGSHFFVSMACRFWAIKVRKWTQPTKSSWVAKSIHIWEFYNILFYHFKKSLYQLYNMILQYSQHPNFYFTIQHIKIIFIRNKIIYSKTQIKTKTQITSATTYYHHHDEEHTQTETHGHATTITMATLPPSPPWTHIWPIIKKPHPLSPPPRQPPTPPPWTHTKNPSQNQIKPIANSKSKRWPTKKNIKSKFTHNPPLPQPISCHVTPTSATTILCSPHPPLPRLTNSTTNPLKNNQTNPWTRQKQTNEPRKRRYKPRRCKPRRKPLNMPPTIKPKTWPESQPTRKNEPISIIHTSFIGIGHNRKK